MAMLRFLRGAPANQRAMSSGTGRLYSQARSPVAAFRAWSTLAGLGRYITPPCTSGVASWMPAVMPRVQTMRRVPTFDLLIWLSGL